MNEHPDHAHHRDRRTLLRTLAIGGGAAAAGAVVLGQTAKANNPAGSLLLLDVPVRVADTRELVPSGTPPINGSIDVDLKLNVTGQPSGVPAETTAALLTVTVTNTRERGWFRAFARGQTIPTDVPFSSGNWVGENLSVATSVTTRVDDEVFITVEIGGGLGNCDIVADVIGYYVPAVT